DEWVAFVPGRAPVAPVHPRVAIVRHRLGGRALFGAAAIARRPTLAALAGGADVVWIPAPAPVAPGAAYVLTVHDRSGGPRPPPASPATRRPGPPGRGPPPRPPAAAGAPAATHAVAPGLRPAGGVRAPAAPPGAPATPAQPRVGRYLLYVGAREPRKGV